MTEKRTTGYLRADNARDIELHNAFNEGYNAAMKYVQRKLRCGEIVNNVAVSRKFLSGADVELQDRSHVQLALSYSVDDHEPMVTLDGKTFILSWEEIIDLAEIAGLFLDSKSEVTE